MNQAQADKLIIKYLKKRGLSDLSDQLQQQLQGQAGQHTQNFKQVQVPELPLEHGFLLQLISDQENKTHITKQFWQLVDWVDHSLEQYRVEFQYIVYPIFVHVYLHLVAQNLVHDSQLFYDKYYKHQINQRQLLQSNNSRDQELKELKSITSTQQISNNKVSMAALMNRYKVRMSPFAYSILMEFLQRNLLWSILSFLNQYLEIQISNAENSKSQSELQSQYLTPIDISQLSKINQKVVRLNLLENSFTVKYIRDVVLREQELNQDGVNQMNIDHNLSQQSQGLDVQGQETDLDQMNKYFTNTDQNLQKSGQSIQQSGQVKEWRSIIRNRMLENTIKFKGSSIPLQRIQPDIDYKIQQEYKQQATVDELNLPSILYLTLQNSEDSLNCCQFLGDASMWIGGQQDGSLLLYDIQKQQSLNQRNSEEQIAIDGSIQVSQQDTQIISGHTGPIFSLDILLTRDYVITASGDGTVGLWNIRLGSKITQYKGHVFSVWDVQCCPSTIGYFVSGGADRTVRIWSYERSQAVRILSGHSQDIDVVQWHPNSQYVFSASQDNTIRMWDNFSGQSSRVFQGINEDVTAIRISKDGLYMACGTINGSLVIYDIREGTQICSLLNAHSLQNKGCSIWSMDFSQTDGALLATGGADHQIHIWNSRLIDESRNLLKLSSYSVNPISILSLQFSTTNLLLGAGQC